MITQPNHDKLAYCGEQVLSFLDEIIRTACPKCGLCELNVCIVGKSLVLRCSESLKNYNDESDTELTVCDFIKTIRPVNLGTLNMDYSPDKRATAQNRKVTRKYTRRTK